MSSTDPLPHPFLSGALKNHFIDGRYVEPLTGRWFETRNPATGELLATVAEGEAADIDRAVAAARKAFETGPWPRTTPSERQAILHRLADLVEKEADGF